MKYEKPPMPDLSEEDLAEVRRMGAELKKTGKYKDDDARAWEVAKISFFAVRARKKAMREDPTRENNDEMLK